MSRLDLIARALFALTLATTAGCAGGGEDPGLPEGPGAQQQGPGATPPEDTPAGGGAGEQVAPGVRQLVIDGALSHLAFHGETVRLPVYYLDARDAPVAGQRIRGRLLDTPNGVDQGPSVQGAGLSSAQVTTDANGLATFELIAGALDAQFTVEASADGAAPVYWNITIGQSAGGHLRVIIEAAEPRPAHAIVGLHPSPGCAAAEAGAQPMQQAGPTNLDPVSTTVEVGELADGALVSVAVTGHSGDGEQIAFGCVDGVQIKGGQDTTVRVSIDALPVRLDGQFDVTHNFDLTQALGENTVLRTIGEIGRGEVSRGNAIVGLLCDNVDLNEILCIALRAVGGGLIDNYIDSSVAPETLESLDALGDLYDAVSDLTVEGQMSFATSGDQLTGEQRWTALSFQWRDGCPFRDPNACMNTFSMADLEVPGGVIEGDFTASADGDAVSIDAHMMPLPYGTAVRVAAEYWVLPEALGRPGPVTVEDVVADLLPCADLAASIPVLTEDFCRDTLAGALADLVYTQFAGLNPGLEGMTLWGTVRAGDRLEQGQWQGTMDGLGAITGIFSSL